MQLLRPGPKSLLILHLFLLPPLSAHSQESGNPFIQNYTPAEYEAYFQNWDTVQDSSGIMYFGNTEGILTYNGDQWDMIHTTNKTIVRNLIKGPSGKIFAGGKNEIGYIKPDSTGERTFVNISDSLREANDLSFGDVWEASLFRDKLFFFCKKKVLQWDGEQLRTLETPGPVEQHCIRNDTLYGYVLGQGIYRISEKGRFERLDSIPSIATKEVYGFLPWKGDSLLISTRTNGHFLYKNGTLSPFETEDDEMLRKSVIYDIMRLSEDRISIATRRNGVIILRKDGSIEAIYNKESGLQNENCWGQTLDDQNNLWVTLNKGIAKIDQDRPFSIHNERNGLKGNSYELCKWNKRLYVATSQGLFVMDSGQRSIRFEHIPAFKAQTWALLPLEENLLVGTSNGLFLWDGRRANRLNNEVNYSLRRSTHFPDKFYAGLEKGLFVYTRKNGKWNGKRAGNIDAQIRSIVETPDTSVWLGTYNSGVIRLIGRKGKILPARSIHYGKKKGLHGEVDVFPYKERLVFSTDSGLYRHKGSIEEQLGALEFMPDTSFGDRFCNGKRVIYRFKEDSKGRIWVYAPHRQKDLPALGYLSRKNGEMEWCFEPFLALPGQDVFAFYEGDKGIWFGGVEYLAHYKPSSSIPEMETDFRTIIGEVRAGRDSVIKRKPIGNTTADPIRMPFSENNIGFRFAATSYVQEEENEFRYKLEGFDRQWSDWTTKTEKHYTNISEGEHTFRVQSRNIYLKRGKQARYTFTVQPPWYRTGLAYAGYFILGIGFVMGSIRLSIQRLKKQKERLEAIVEERTREIKEQKNLVEEQHKEIRDSINYASRMQEALLPSIPRINSLFRDSFVLLKPRDIVSGDFYWVASKQEEDHKDLRFIVAADCTGHGVPGAFMSMLGVSFLNDVVLERQITDTGTILTRLRDMVITTLNREQQGEETKDGMDMALCRVDGSNRELHFAGANNPLYLIRRNDTGPKLDADRVKVGDRWTLYEFKGDKQAVAFEEGKEAPFQTRRIPVQPGDRVYMFSDGYADQFGGEKGKKFRYRNFKELLLQIQEYTMEEQRSVLERTIEEWRGNLEQIDDICVVGFTTDHHR